MHEIIYAILIAFAVSLMIGHFAIPILRKMKFGQSVREDGPKTHIVKTGTPTMGGVIFLLTILLVTISMSLQANQITYACLFTVIGFALVGFIDDGIKIKRKQNLGLRAYQKLIAQLIVAIAFTYFAYTCKEIGSTIFIPFVRLQINLGIWYIPFTILTILASVNAVNLTDGLDGLAAGTALIICGFFLIILIVTGDTSISILCAAAMGSLLGFLKFNSHPAEVFMGDTGSLALGGLLAAIAITMKIPLILIIVAFVMVVETASVIIQVAVYKRKKKRVFLMTPLHHHFEQLGWEETRVVAVFYIATVVCCLIGFLSL